MPLEGFHLNSQWAGSDPAGAHTHPPPVLAVLAATRVSGHAPSPQQRAALSLPPACVVRGSAGDLGGGHTQNLGHPFSGSSLTFSLSRWPQGLPSDSLGQKHDRPPTGVVDTHTQPWPVLWPKLDARELPPSSDTQPPLPAFVPVPSPEVAVFR